jgi:protein-tyrosine phosphatase
VIDQLRVLSVCTHNRTRSVLVGALLREHLRQAGLDADVATAGTAGSGLPATDRTVRLLAARGIDVRDHRSQPLDERSVAGADLVVTAERDHVVWIAGRWPGAFRRTFTLPELVARAAAVQPMAGDVSAWLDELAVDRPTAIDYLDADVGEIADPTGRAPGDWDVAFAHVDDLTRRLASAIAAGQVR